jgi:RNA-binding protein
MPAPKLSGRESRHLRALGHALDPIIAIGKHGITESLVKETARALLTHELIKVRVQTEAPVDRKDAAHELATATDSSVAQVLGRTFLLYRRHPKKPTIVFPRQGTKGEAAAVTTAEKTSAPKRARSAGSSRRKGARSPG